MSQPLTLDQLPVGTSVTIPGTIHAGTVWVVTAHVNELVVVSDGYSEKTQKPEWLKIYKEPMQTPDPNQSMRQYSEAQFQPIKKVIDALEDLMRYKNRKYGNSGLSSDGVFSKTSTLDKLLARADDKVARIKNSPELRVNDTVDLIGYLVLICAHNGWDNFDKFKD